MAGLQFNSTPNLLIRLTLELEVKLNIILRIEDLLFVRLISKARII